MTASYCSCDVKCLVSHRFKIGTSHITCKRVFFAQATKMAKHGLVFCILTLVLFRLFRLKTAAFVRCFPNFRNHITTIFVFFNTQFVQIIVFFSFFISFAVQKIEDFPLCKNCLRKPNMNHKNLGGGGDSQKKTG